jgi:hypothetical protein
MGKTTKLSTSSETALAAVLEAAVPAPRGTGSKLRIMSTDALINLACPVVLAKCLDRADFTASQIREAVPQIATAYEHSNWLATALGSGAKGKGLRLWRGKAGEFRACLENAALAAKRLTPEQLEKLAAARGLDGIEALAEEIKALPTAVSN